MNPIEGYHLVPPDELSWRLAEPMKIPYKDLLDKSGSEIIGARLWRFPPQSAGTWHKHVKAEEFYFVLEGTGRIRGGGETLTVPEHGSIIVGPGMMRQVFNDTEEEVLWLMIGAPDQEFEEGESFDIKRFWPEDPTQLPKEMAGMTWPLPGDS